MGSTHHGLLFADGIDKGIPATLDMTVGGPQFTLAFEESGMRTGPPASWFTRHGDVPQHLAFQTQELHLTCFGVANWSHAMGNIAVARIEPTAIVADRWHGEHDARLTASTVQSEVDRLSDWTRFSAARTETETDERNRVQRLSIELAQHEQLAWKQGEAAMTLTTNWEHTPGMVGVHYDEAVVLESRFESDRPIRDHMVEQRKVRDLLAIMYNAPAYFRRHRVRSKFIHEISGETREPYNHLVDMIGGLSTHEQGNPQPGPNSGLFAVVYPGQFGPSGFESWAESYERMERVIRPIVRILQRPQALSEDRVVAIGMALEAAGVLLPKAPGESETYRRGSEIATAATSVYRVLSVAGIGSERLASSLASLAQGVARTYNDIKHPNHDLPSEIQSYGVAALGVLALQVHLAKDALGYAEPVSERYGDHFVDEIALLWERLGLYLGKDGKFERRDLPAVWPRLFE